LSSLVLKLFHRDLGGRAHPPLVILHGLLGSSRNWQTAGANLASRFHVCALDLRNHGRSPQADEMTYGAMFDDVLAWLDAHGIAKVTLLGHSLGGKVAMLLACRRPERVEQLVVVDIAPKAYAPGAHRAEFAAMNELDLARLSSRAEAEREMEMRVPEWAMRKFLVTNLDHDADGHWRWQINLPGLTRALPELESNPLASADRYSGPALFVLGGKSRYVLAQDHETIRRPFPLARIETIAGSGHNPHMETREEFVRLVLTADES
jgi:pimeloyl-ACP methyl ester carboxylesterase